MPRLQNNSSIGKMGKLNIVIATCLVIALMTIIIRYVYTINSPFWIIIPFIIETGLAFASFGMRQYSKLIFILLFIFSIFVPLMFAAFISFLKPILISPLVFLSVAIVISTFSQYKRRFKTKTTPIKLPSNLAFKAVFPTDLPLGLVCKDNTIHKKKSQTTLEIYYQNDNDGSWLWIYESNGAIIRDEIKLQKQKLDNIINSISVNMSQEIPKNNSSRKKIKPPYIEAIWNYKGINFNVRTDWISSEDVEKIIKSMIK